MVTTPPLPVIPTGSSSSGGDYGLSGDAASHKFDVTGLNIPGLSGLVDGKTLLQYFIASGSGRLGDGGAAAAAIQHALWFGQAYSDKKASPTFGKVGDADATAFAQALNLLDKANASQPQSVNGLTAPSETVYQYLTRNAAIGAASGAATGGSVADVRDRSHIPVPDETSLMAIADKAFQAVQGKHATLDQQRAFARSFQAQYQQTEIDNANAYYRADPRVQDALAAQQPATFAEQQAAPDPLAVMRAGERANENGDPNPTGFDLSHTMTGLQDATSSGALLGNTNVIEQSPPDASVAAENYARNTNPKGAAGNDTANVFDLFRQILQTHFGG